MGLEHERVIANQTHNTFLNSNIEKHKSTKIAPDTFFKPISKDNQVLINAKQAKVEQELEKALGKPYFKDEGFILYQGDCVEMMSKLSKTSFKAELTVTSPPYNIGKEYETNKPVDQFVDWCTTWLKNIYDITADKGALWLNVGYFAVPKKGLCVPISYLLWDKTPFYMLQEVVWQYGAGVSSKRYLSPRNEKWLWYVKEQDNYTFNLDDIRDPNVKYPNQKKNGKFRCNPLGKNPSDVWQFPKVTTGANRSSKERTGHPAQFPLGVVERVVLGSSNIADVILDPFAGSSSAGIAAYGTGRIFVGFELRSDYCEISKERYLNFKREKAAANQ